jgi:hypothetical protein
MRTISAYVVCLLISAAGALGGPMDTVQITITGGKLTRPVVIMDEAVLGQIKVWAGPGNFRREAGVDIPIPFPQGFIVDWSRGPAEPPVGGRVYQASFRTTRPARNVYRVTYVIGADDNGYVYLPGKGEGEYADNTFMILRGVEGNWFHAWSKWEEIARPLIANSEPLH